jgi:hypothetical protein
VFEVLETGEPTYTDAEIIAYLAGEALRDPGTEADPC